MLKLILFAACEKIIIGKDNTASIISLLEHITLTGDVAKDLPKNAALPMRWGAIALWQREEDLSEDVLFEYKLEVVEPNGFCGIESVGKMMITNKHLNFRHLFQFDLFPIGQDGIYRLKLSGKKSETEWERIGEFPVRVIHKTENVADENEAKDEQSGE